MRISASVSVSAIVLGITVLPSDARALTDAMVGPTLGYDFSGRSITFGWEAGVGTRPRCWGILGTRFNVGQQLGAGLLTYAVAEPWYLVAGGTLGGGYRRGTGVVGVAGAWSGLPVWPYLTEPRVRVVYPGQHEPSREWLVSLALGYRYTGHHEIYLTPKIGVTEVPQGCTM
jgi:hypothetical protein